jgi:hypothetical protein
MASLVADDTGGIAGGCCSGVSQTNFDRTGTTDHMGHGRGSPRTDGHVDAHKAVRWRIDGHAHASTDGYRARSKRHS